MRALIFVWLLTSTVGACDKKPEAKDPIVPPESPSGTESQVEEPAPADAPSAASDSQGNPEPAAAEPAPLLPIPTPPREPALTVAATQFWVYETNAEDKLSFNLPWDKTPGSDVIRDPNDSRVPEHAKACAVAALEALNATLVTDPVAMRLDKLSALGVTRQAFILVNVIPSAKHRANLADLDRDAYFWHLNAMKERPSLALSRFKEGRWVWEVISSPEEGCAMPPETDMIRYLDYATARLTPKKEGV